MAAEWEGGSQNNTPDWENAPWDPSEEWGGNIWDDPIAQKPVSALTQTTTTVTVEGGGSKATTMVPLLASDL